MIEPSLTLMMRLVPEVKMIFPLTHYSRYANCEALMVPVTYGLYLTDGSVMAPGFRFLDVPAIRFGHAAGKHTAYSYDEKRPGVYTLETAAYSRFSSYKPDWRKQWEEDGVDPDKIVVAVAPAAAWLRNYYAEARWCRAREEDLIMLHGELYGQEPVYNLDGEHSRRNTEKDIVSRKALKDANSESTKTMMEESGLLIDSNE